MKYLVTGGAGFIGSHLVEHLLSNGHEVVVLDNLSTGKMENLSNVVDNEKFTFVNVDLTNWNELTKQFSYFKQCSGVFHLAAFARIQPSIYDPMHCMNINVQGTLHVLEMMRMTGCDKIVYSASSSRYGLANNPPFKEWMHSDCLNPYSASKYQSEVLCKTWGKMYGIKNVSLVYFNVFGDRSPLNIGAYSPVVSLFYAQALRDNKNLTVVGDGKQSRDFTYVLDVAVANLKAMQNLETSATANGQSINIGTGKSIMIVDLAKKVKESINTIQKMKISIKHIDSRLAECRHVNADITLAKQLIDWEPITTLDVALDHLKFVYLKQFERK